MMRKKGSLLKEYKLAIIIVLFINIIGNIA